MSGASTEGATAPGTRAVARMTPGLTRISNVTSMSDKPPDRTIRKGVAVRDQVGQHKYGDGSQGDHYNGNHQRVHPHPRLGPEPYSGRIDPPRRAPLSATAVPKSQSPR